MLMLALMVVSVIGMLFPNTRQIGLLCLAVLCLLSPVLVVLLVLVGASGYLCFKLYRRKNNVY